MADLSHLRILAPHPGILAFYDGRVPGHRFAGGPNWVDDGALSLGIASYAVVSGDQALVYDSHVSLPHALAIRAALEARGVRRFTVVLSHWHLDHVAGTAAFPGAPVIANARTAAHLARHRAGIEDASFHGAPAIRPLVLPTRLFSGRMTLQLGDVEVQLIEADIHSDDATVLWLPETRLLLAGDTVEDCATYVGEPEGFARHLADLDRLAALNPAFVLPNHGAAGIIAAGGYPAGILGATQDYIRWLQALPTRPDQATRPLAEVIAPALEAGVMRYFAPYEEVHRQNIARTVAALSA